MENTIFMFAGSMAGQSVLVYLLYLGSQTKLDSVSRALTFTLFVSLISSISYALNEQTSFVTAGIVASIVIAALQIFAIIGRRKNGAATDNQRFGMQKIARVIAFFIVVLFCSSGIAIIGGSITQRQEVTYGLFFGSILVFSAFFIYRYLSATIPR